MILFVSLAGAAPSCSELALHRADLLTGRQPHDRHRVLRVAQCFRLVHVSQRRHVRAQVSEGRDAALQPVVLRDYGLVIGSQHCSGTRASALPRGGHSEAVAILRVAMWCAYAHWGCCNWNNAGLNHGFNQCWVSALPQALDEIRRATPAEHVEDVVRPFLCVNTRV